MSSVGGSGTGSLFKSIRLGAGVWGTFRFLSALVYAACWILALPAELVLNRRMGRRYSGLIPLVLASLLLVPLFFANGAARGGFDLQRDQGKIFAVAAMSVFVAELVFFLAVCRHRVASWWRFQSHEQVHSFSCGVPFWLNPPAFAIAWLPKAKTPTPKETLRPDNGATVPPGKGTRGFLAVVAIFAKHIQQQFPPFIREWKSGAIPTGPFMWFASTVVHPVLLLLLSFPAALISPSLGFYLWVAAFAIFLKARIQKALIIETVYDLFDARIEHEFTQSLSNPQRLRNVERTGLIVPGLARTLGESMNGEASGTLAPELARLLSEHTSRVEVKPTASGTGNEEREAVASSAPD